MKFKPEDFDGFVKGAYPLGMTAMDAIALFANIKLEKWLESWPIIFLTQTPLGNLTGQSVLQYPHQTHKARLAFIEEIVKEPCRHEVDCPSSKRPSCVYCGVELVAEWKAKS